MYSQLQLNQRAFGRSIPVAPVSLAIGEVFVAVVAAQAMRAVVLPPRLWTDVLAPAVATSVIAAPEIVIWVVPVPLSVTAPRPRDRHGARSHRIPNFGGSSSGSGGRGSSLQLLHLSHCELHAMHLP
jgi:hypothetical protein